MAKNFKQQLEAAARGKSILFCGAGASLDSIGFDLQELPSANPLLNKFNEYLGKKYTRLPIAASKVADHSIQKYFEIITDSFRVRSVSDDMKSVMSFPWSRVYTTNYDNSVELACDYIGKKNQTLTAKDQPSDIMSERLPVIHLHGFINHFRIDTIRSECILDYSSNVANQVYDGPWATELKNDISTADIVVFLGYSLYDPEISKLILQGGNSRKKIFFVNSKAEDEELAYMQDNFGAPMGIEKDGFARIIEGLPVSTDVSTRKYVCFRSAKDLKVEHRTVNYQDLNDLFLFGRVQEDLIQADIVSGSSSYVVKPSLVNAVRKKLENGAGLLFISSPLGHGKTIFCNILAGELSQDSDVFIAIRNQENFASEVDDIVNNYKRPIFIIDDYYKYYKHHKALAKLSSDDACFIFTSRMGVHETRKEELAAQFLNHEICDIQMGKLSLEDAKALVPLINQAGMWGELSDLPNEQKAKRLLSSDEQGFQGNFADILVGLMYSNEMIARITKELEILKSISNDAYEVVLISMYLEFTNNHVDDLVIDQTLAVNLNEIQSSTEVANVFRLFFTPSDGGNGYFSGSIFARYAMERICDHGDLISVIEKAAGNLAGSYPLYEEMRLVLVDLLRFNYLKVIASGDQSRLRRISNLYSNLSSNSNLNRDDLFWNAFGMCERAQKEFGAAIKHFRTSIRYAKLRGPNYVPYHAQNQLIVCLLERGISLNIDVSMAYSDLREVLELLILQADDERIHGRGQAFAWHKEIISFLDAYYEDFQDSERMFIKAQIMKYVTFIVRNVSGWESRREAALTVRKLQSFLSNHQE